MCRNSDALHLWTDVGIMFSNMAPLNSLLESRNWFHSTCFRTGLAKDEHVQNRGGGGGGVGMYYKLYRSAVQYLM